MPYFSIEDFKAGLDVRRSRFTSVPGTLQQLVNAHITRGGDIERRKEFTDKGLMQGNTFGLAADVEGLVTFGSAAAPAGPLPDGVRYQQLTAPNGSAMTGIAAAEQFGAYVYVVANYADGGQWHFYNGEIVGDWGGGIVADYMVDNEGIAEHLVDLINAGDIYSASSVGDLVTIVGPEGVDFSIDAETEHSETGSISDQNVLLSTVSLPVTADDEDIAQGAFAIKAGKVGVGNAISNVTVYEGTTPITVLGSSVLFVQDARVTATAVANAINAGVGTHGYSAAAELGVVKIYAPQSDGITANGRVVQTTTTGEVCIDDGSFSVTAGSAGAAGVNSVKVLVNGISVMAAAIDWATSNSATAAAVAASINAFASVPKLVATAIGETIYVSRKVCRSDDAELTIGVTSTGTAVAGAGRAPPEGNPNTRGIYDSSEGVSTQIQ
jgi:hypothetical protein